jgi:demethylmenaquinone methyltransferase/2-methoxy-6-polyprenyl-1,4-benzoquinol methylase
MGNTFYDPGEQRAARVRDLFARIAPRYDLINDLQSFGLHRCWKRHVVQLARPKPNELALDLCCGTGDVALMLAHSGVRAIGADFSERMLAVALHRSRREAPEHPHATPTQPDPHAHFIQADALSAPFPDRSFDIITMAYGLRNLADVKAGLREMKRLAKPGARLVVLDFGKPDNTAWRWIYFSYLKLFVPLLGLVFCRSASAYAYILESLQHYPAQRGVAAHMRELGLGNVRIVEFMGGVMSINYAEATG